MRATTLLLALSLALNVGLGIYALRAPRGATQVDGLAEESCTRVTSHRERV
jgi:hypothetical protein